jgi:hypothetical protein
MGKEDHTLLKIPSDIARIFMKKTPAPFSERSFIAFSLRHDFSNKTATSSGYGLAYME